LDGQSGFILVTLGILEVIEQQSLLISIHGSPDGTDWTASPLVEFPQKFYTGVSAVLIDTTTASIRFLRAEWKADRWGRGSKTPSFRFYLFAELIDG
jgi:hypothetical protein